MRGLVLGCLAIAGCGRIGFDPASSTDAAVPTSFRCDAPTVAITNVIIDGSARSVALADGGSELALAYWRPGASQIEVQRLTRGGVLSGGPTLMSAQAGSVMMGAGGPSIAFDGTSQYAIARTEVDASEFGPVVVTRIDLGGNALGSDTAISTAGYYPGASTIVSSGHDFGLAWDAFRIPEIGAWFARIGGDGTRQDAGTSVTGFGDCLCTPKIAWSGTEWGVVASNDGFAPVPGYSPLFTGISASGSVVVPTRALNAIDSSNFMAISANPRHFVVAWTVPLQTEIALARVAHDGSTTETRRIPVTNGSTVTLTSHGEAFALLYAQDSGVALWPIDSEGVPGSAVTLIALAPGIVSLAAVSTADGFFIAFEAAGNVGFAHVTC